MTDRIEHMLTCQVHAVTIPNFPVPVDETTYKEFCFNLQGALGLPTSDTPYHIIGFEPLILEDTKKYLHHFTLYASLDMCSDAGDMDKGPMIWLWVSVAHQLPEIAATKTAASRHCTRKEGGTRARVSERAWDRERNC